METTGKCKSINVQLEQTSRILKTQYNTSLKHKNILAVVDAVYTDISSYIFIIYIKILILVLNFFQKVP